MKGVYTAKVKEITILGILNEINVQVKMEVDYGEGVSGIDVVKQITEYWHAAGLQPPVRGSKTAYRTVGERGGATGTHPREDIPKFTRGADPFLCPNCGRPTYKIEWVVKNPKATNYGNTMTKWTCPKAKGGCGAWNFGDRTDARFEDEHKD